MADELRGALRSLRHERRGRAPDGRGHPRQMPVAGARQEPGRAGADEADRRFARALSAVGPDQRHSDADGQAGPVWRGRALYATEDQDRGDQERPRSEEHTSELQSLMRKSYAVFCLKKKNNIENSTK